MSKKNKEDIVNGVSYDTRQPIRVIRPIVNSAIQYIIKSLENGDTFYLKGLGEFYFKQINPRTVANNITKDRVPFEVQPYKIVKFRPSIELAKRIKAKYRAENGLVDNSTEVKKKSPVPEKV